MILKMWKKGKSNSDKRNKLNSEMIWKISTKSKLKCEMI